MTGERSNSDKNQCHGWIHLNRVVVEQGREKCKEFIIKETRGTIIFADVNVVYNNKNNIAFCPKQVGVG